VVSRGRAGLRAALEAGEGAGVLQGVGQNMQSELLRRLANAAGNEGLGQLPDDSGDDGETLGERRR